MSDYLDGQPVAAFCGNSIHELGSHTFARFRERNREYRSRSWMSCKPLSRCAPDRQPAVPCPHRSVHPREPGDRNATIVAFVRDCRSEATTRAGGSRQRIMCPGRDRIRGSAGWCTGRRFLAAAVSRVVAGAGAMAVSQARSVTTILFGRLYRRWTQRSLSTARLQKSKLRSACTSNGTYR